MSMNHHLPKKISLKPKRHHGFQAVLFLLGMILPPLAVAARFGIGSDFFINVFLTIAGYFPSHIHNFYIQNIRNNTHRARTPKWALKAGLVSNEDNERRARKNQWSKRFDERNSASAHVGQALEEGEEGDNYVPIDPAEREAEERRRTEGLWTRGDEEYYNEDEAPNQAHWSYPMNFHGAVSEGTGRKKSRSGTSDYGGNGDRWERSRAAHQDTSNGPTHRNSVDSITGASAYPTTAATDDDVPEWGRDYGSKSKAVGKKTKKSNKKSPASDWVNNGNFVQDGPDNEWGDAGGGGGRPNGNANVSNGGAKAGRGGEPNWDHEF